MPRRRRTPIARVLALALFLVTLIPFLPLAWFTWNGYNREVAEVEREIQESNRHIASLATSHLDAIITQIQLAARLTGYLGNPPQTQLPIWWEQVGSDGRVMASEIDSQRIGKPSGYGEFMNPSSDENWCISPVGEWITGHPPTVVFGDSHSGRVAVLDTEALHNEMQAWAQGNVDRHLYTVDGQGHLLFYSDLAVSRRGEDLRSNPPIELLLHGKDGEIRYHSTVSGRPRLAYVQHLRETDWGIVVSADVGATLVTARHAYTSLAWSIGFALATAITILLWTSRRLVAPVRDIGRALNAMDHHLHAPLAVHPSTRSLTEYDALVTAFDNLNTELAITENELVHAERISVMGQVASGLAHEMGTPLNIITGNAQYLLRKTASPDPSVPVLQLIIGQAARITGMIQRLLDLSRPQPARLVPVNLGNLVKQILELVPCIGDRVQAIVEIEPGAVQVLADSKLLEHAVLNLVVNACQAMPDGGELRISVALSHTSENPMVVLRVADTGTGIPTDHLTRIFEPFFSTKPAPEGTGLGLAIVERIVLQHKARIEVVSKVGEGTVFSIFMRPAPLRT